MHSQLSSATTSDPLAFLDDFAEELQRAPSPECVARLIVRADELRRTLPIESWKPMAERMRAHPIATLLLEDPNTRRAREKPRGYAGDAVMLDYLYDGIDEPLAQRAAAIFGATTGGRSSAAVRERRERLADMIDEAAASTAPVVLSVACGHARELELSTALSEGRVARVVCIDQDPESLANISARWGDAVDTICGSVRQVLTGKLPLPTADLVTSAGLFDYLDDAVALALLIKAGAGGAARWSCRHRQLRERLHRPWLHGVLHGLVAHVSKRGRHARSCPPPGHAPHIGAHLPR